MRSINTTLKLSFGIVLISLIIISGCSPNKLLKINSGSMEPAIKKGSFVSMEEVIPSDLKVGDIVVFETGRGLIAARIVSLDFEKETFTTKGDANNAIAPFEKDVPLDSIKGRIPEK